MLRDVLPWPARRWAAVVDVLWGAPNRVRDVLEPLAPQRALAYTTVMTVPENLHRKGWVVRERDGKAYRCEPSLIREEAAARAMRRVLDVTGDPEAVLLNFPRSASEREQAALRKALERRRRQIDAGRLVQVGEPMMLKAGQSAALDDGTTVQFLGTRPFITLSVRYNPGAGCGGGQRGGAPGGSGRDAGRPPAADLVPGTGRRPDQRRRAAPASGRSLSPS